MVRIIQAETPEDVDQASSLFREYAATLGVDLSFQNFDRELATLPGDYAPPGGRLFLAFVEVAAEESARVAGGKPAGCVALRKIEGDICEMKRLYVKPDCRGCGAGKALAEAAITAARAIGYRRMRLDTLPQMSQAQELYRALGFREIPAYRFNPVSGTRYFELALAEPRG